MRSAFLLLVDSFFRITATEFKILPSDEALDLSLRNLGSKSETSDDINLGFLRSFSRNDIVAAIREMSFKDTLVLLSSLSTPSRQHILCALEDFHDLKAALRFALDFEQGSTTFHDPIVKDYPVERLAIKFLRLLSEHSTAAAQLVPEPAAETCSYVPIGKPGKPLQHTG